MWERFVLLTASAAAGVTCARPREHNVLAWKDQYSLQFAYILLYIAIHVAVIYHAGAWAACLWTAVPFKHPSIHYSISRVLFADTIHKLERTWRACDFLGILKIRRSRNLLKLQKYEKTINFLLLRIRARKLHVTCGHYEANTTGNHAHFERNSSTIRMSRTFKAPNSNAIMKKVIFT